MARTGVARAAETRAGRIKGRLVASVTVLVAVMLVAPERVRANHSAGHTNDSTTTTAMPSGSLDTTFGLNGFVQTDFEGRDDAGLAVVVHPDGKLVAAGCSDGGTWQCRYQTGGAFALARYTPNGDLDATFGTDGRVTTRIERDGTANDLLLQPDGKLLAVGSATTCLVQGFGFVGPNGCGTGIALARYHPDGSLDATFGVAGRVVTSPVVTGFAALHGSSVALQSDHKIVVAGSVCNVPPFGSGCPLDMVLARFSSTGQLDTTFGRRGLATVDFHRLDDIAHDVVVIPDGGIVVAGLANAGTTCTDVCLEGWNFALARLTIKGELDTSFGVNGKVTTDFDGEASRVTSLQLQTVDETLRLVATGDVTSWKCFSGHCQGVRDLALAAFTHDGMLVTEFGAGGKVRTNLAGMTTDAGRAAIDGANRIVVAATSCTTALDDVICRAAAVRYTTHGDLDSAWGDNGVVAPAVGDSAGAVAVAIQADDGKVVIAGDVLNGRARDVLLVRYIG